MRDTGESIKKKTASGSIDYDLPQAHSMTEEMKAMASIVSLNNGIDRNISEQPNEETIAAMLEAERIAEDPSAKGYNDLDELFEDLKA